MKQLLTVALEAEDWSVDDISNYGFTRNSGGIYVLTMWKGKKTEKGTKRSVVVKIDRVREHMFLAVRTLEGMMDDHGASGDFTKRLDDDDPDGFGGM